MTLPHLFSHMGLPTQSLSEFPNFESFLFTSCIHLSILILDTHFLISFSFTFPKFPINPQESTTHLNGLIDPLHMKPVSVNIAIDHNSPKSEPLRNHHNSISNFVCLPQGFSFLYAWVWGYGPQIFPEISPMLWQGWLLMGSESWFKSLWWTLILVASCGRLCCEKEN